jgi:Lon-like ATP-dependent protease
VQASNPVILIDEIDKLGRGHRGDPAAALLEVLDPEQNNAFTDHYLDVPVDLSKVLFIATANDRSRIPGPLADRMDFIELSGYVMQEKLHIAENHLLPSIRAKVGLSEEQIKLEPEALLHLIRWYCREAGVRGLQKQLEKIHRKVALTIARAAAVEEEEAAAAVAAAKSKEDESAAVSGVKEAELVESSPASSSTANPAPAVTAPLLSPASLQLPIVINVASLSQYVGKPVHSSDRMYETNPVGVATGLGTNSIGGSLLYIECTTADQALTLPEDAVRVPSAASAPTTTPKKKGSGASSAPPAPQRLGRGELFCTGQLGDVIKESSSIAYTVAKRLVAKYTHALSPHRAFFEQHRIHLHMPEGATPKDGPSAGIAMVTALLSLALNCAPLHAHAMTGELTLTGKVLGIGGVKEKLMAAKHAGIRTVILPLDNQKDVVELKPYVIEGLDIHYAAEFDDVFQRIFPHFVDHVEPPFADHARIGMDALTATNDKKQKKTKTNKRATNDSNAPATSGPSILPLQQPTAETKQPNAS